MDIKKGFRVSFIDEDNNEQFGIITRKWVKKAQIKLDNGDITFVPLDELEIAPITPVKVDHIDDQFSTIVENPIDDQIPFDELELDQDDSDNDHPYVDDSGILHTEIYLNPNSPSSRYYDQIKNLELIIDQNLSSIANSFYQIGRALSMIKENNLYADYDSFGEYCEARWDFKSAYAYFLINSYLVCDNLVQAGFSRLPVNESQCRVLSSLSNDDQIKVWRIISETPKITASLIKSEVEKIEKQQKAIAPSQTSLFTPAVFQESYEDNEDDADEYYEDDETDDYPNELISEANLVIDEDYQDYSDHSDDHWDSTCTLTIYFQRKDTTFYLEIGSQQTFKKLTQLLGELENNTQLIWDAYKFIQNK
jgi:hypothetical protein